MTECKLIYAVNIIIAIISYYNLTTFIMQAIFLGFLSPLVYYSPRILHHAASALSHYSGKRFGLTRNPGLQGIAVTHGSAIMPANN